MPRSGRQGQSREFEPEALPGRPCGYERVVGKVVGIEGQVGSGWVVGRARWRLNRDYMGVTNDAPLRKPVLC